MKYLKVLVLAVLMILPLNSVTAQEESVFEIIPLTEKIYELTTDGGGYTVKVIALVGEDGILIVDAGQKATGEDLKKALGTLGNSIPEIIINTHAHMEHTGGNFAFGRDPVIIGHTMLRKTLRSGSYLFDEFPDEALPEITFDDSLTIYFNGEEIKLLSFAGAHDNSDIIVWFTESKVVCVGALSNGTHFPSVDGTTGDVMLYPVTVKKLLDILPDDVTIVPGHGVTGTMTQFRAFYDMLVGTEAAVREGLKQGKTLEQLQEEDVLKEWTSFDGSYVDKNGWIQYLVKGIEGDDGNRELRVAFFETMFRAYKEKGADAAVAKYHEINESRSDDNKITEIEPVIIGYKLFEKKKYNDAIKFFELSVTEFPEGDYPWLCYNNIGSSYKELGNKEQAIKYYKKSLELNPDNTTAAERIKELEGD